MKKTLQRLIEYQTLSQEEARTILLNISQGKYNGSEMTSFMTVFMMRTITVEELAGFRTALYEQCLQLDFSEFKTIDLCGTGGDGKDTFNISTLASFVVAGAGYKVAKHGNYGLSSICGSSNVLEYFGYQFTNDQNILKQQLEACGICFLHAPLFHPAMKAVAPIRKELSIRTFFNVLGPMLNPSSPQFQVVGVFNLEMARHYNYLYQQTNTQYTILHALDGYDEISLTGKVKLINNQGEQILSPEQLGFHTIKASAIAGGKTIEESASLFAQILQGKGTQAQHDVVLANASQAIQCMNPHKLYAECLEEAKESLLGGRAQQSFLQLTKQ